MARLSIVGTSVPRVDALEKATGQAIFGTDIKLPRMLHARVLRSPYPHARIVSIDTSRAEQLSGVACIITGKDVPGKKYGRIIYDQDVLAVNIVRSIGEAVAAVAAETIDIAEEALELIDIEYEQLPAIFDPEEAISTNAPVVIHPDLSKYEYTMPSLRPHEFDRPNVPAHYRVRKGDVEKGFAQSDLVMENRFSAARIQHCAMESRTTTAQPEADGGLTLWLNKQSVQLSRMELVRLFGIEPSKVRVIQPYIGGSFGRGALAEEPVVALLALKTGRPVKQVYTREEVFSLGGTRTPMIVYIKDGVKSDGTLLARQMKVIVPVGGSGESIIALIIKSSSYGAVGTYRIPNFKWDSYGVYINEPPIIGFRGFGSTLVSWAVESHMDMLAEKLGISPVEIRKKNILQEGEANVVGEITHSIGVSRCLDKVTEFIKIDERAKGEGVWKRGRGIGIGNKYTMAPSASGARVRVMEDGCVIVYHGAEEIGQGCDTVMAQITAEEFGIPMDRVTIAYSDSLCMPFDSGTVSSRATFHTGNAVRMACQDAKRQLFERAGQMLGVAPADLETRDGMVYAKGMPDKKVRIAELFTGYKPGSYGHYTTGGEITGNATYTTSSIFAPEDRETGQIDPGLAAAGKRSTASYGHTAKAVEVAVNTETGEVKVLRCGAACDMGQPINPSMCEQQEEGGIGMGIGTAIYEEVILEKGRVLNPSFTDYRMPSANEMPTLDNIKTFLAPVPHKDGPYGAKGFSEGGLIGMDAAIANAVYNAVGVRIKDLPITAEKVLKALKEKEGIQAKC